MMVPDGAETTGLHVNSIGNLFVSAMHPDDPYKATIGVINGFDWNDLPRLFPNFHRQSVNQKFGMELEHQ